MGELYNKSTEEKPFKRRYMDLHRVLKGQVVDKTYREFERNTIDTLVDQIVGIYAHCVPIVAAWKTYKECAKPLVHSLEFFFELAVLDLKILQDAKNKFIYQGTFGDFASKNKALGFIEISSLD